MKQYIKLVIIGLVALLSLGFSYSQNIDDNERKADIYFEIRGSVREKYSYKPIPKVDIEVSSGSFDVTDYDGSFRIKVKLGDQLTVKHKDFETVYQTIVNDDRIIIEVLPQEKPTQKQLRQKTIQQFNQLIDSAHVYLKQDAERSIQFIADALDKSTSQNQNAEAYETLGDLYMFLKQYDLAITNYRIALQNINSNAIQLKLAKAYAANNNNQESIETYLAVQLEQLTDYQKTEFYEGLGDIYIKTNAVTKAITTYQKGLDKAKIFNIKPKETDLNSKIAQAYNITGDTKKAKGFFNSSLNLAKKESKKRSLEEKVVVAEFNSENRNYEDEIELRKQVIEDVEQIEKDSILPNDSPITLQKQNYKIGNALILQNNSAAAIPYLDKSIEEADSREDLEVKNDALRRKADAFKNLGDYENFKKAFEDFMASVDKTYIKKEQEIAEIARLSRKFTENQNRILSLENDRELNKSRYELSVEKNKNQQLIIYTLIGGLFLLLIAAYFTYKYIKQQRLANNLLALKSLRSQMNPHFIFNALNSVNSFIALNDERTANKYLSDFSLLMRAVLENSEEDFIPLQKEIELLELYTKLEHFRFKDKFDYSIEIDTNINVDDYQIPPMLLQPYIENAVWHGLRYKKDKGCLKIEIKQHTQNEITISIIDDGIGRAQSKASKTEHQKKHNSKGLSNIKKRIQILNDMYKDKVDVSINNYKNTGDVGTKVIVTLKKD